MSNQEVPGLTWKNLINSPRGFIFRSLATNGEYFVGVGDTGLCWRSTDGLYWEKGNGGKKLPGPHFGTVFGNGKFVAVGFRGSIQVSSNNGVEWRRITSGITNNFKSIAYAPDKNWFLAPAGSGNYMISKDGGRTFEHKTFKNAGFNGITYGSGRFLIACGNGWVRSMDEQEKWRSYRVIKKPAQKHLMCAAYGKVNGKHTFIAAGREGYVCHSSDNGENWQYKQLSDVNYFYGATYTGKYFVLVGGPAPRSNVPAPIYTSPDGVNWTPHSSHAGINPLLTVSYNNKARRVVAAGQFRMVSSDGTTDTINVTYPPKCPYPKVYAIKKGSTLEIKWDTNKAAGVGNVKIEYSLDGAAGPFNTIYGNIDSKVGKINWEVPDVDTNNGVIRISRIDGTGALAVYSVPYAIRNDTGCRKIKK